MKSQVKIFIYLITLSSILFSCGSPKSMLQKGNYYEAVMKSIDKLKSSPNNKNARETLLNAYPLSVNTIFDELESKHATSYKFKNTESVIAYRALNNMYEGIQRTPAAKEVIGNPTKYYTELSEVVPLAAEEQYRAGIEQLNQQNRESSKQAYYYFIEANNLVKDYKDAGLKMNEAYDLSILKVVTYLKPIQSRSYDLSAEAFYVEVKKILSEIENKGFIKFLTSEQAEKLKIEHPDHYLEISFEDFIVGQTHTKETIRTVQSDSIKVSEIKLDNRTKRDVYDIVEAELTINRMEVISNGLVKLFIQDQQYDKKVLLDRDFAGEYVWFNEWGHFNGDQRALTVEEIEICRRKNIPPIPPQQMFVEFTKPIHSQLRSQLISFYKNY